MEKIETLYDLYMEFVRDLYNAEVLLISELLNFKQMSSALGLKKSIQHYLNDSRAHMQQLEDLIEDMNESLLEDHCRSMKSMIGEAKKLAVRCTAEIVKDFAIAASLQRINQCKVNLYGSLVRMSEDLGLNHNRDILKKCLNDEVSIAMSLETNTKITQT